MDDFKVIPCKSMPIREFILDENRLNLIGVRTTGTGGRYWIALKQADREIENHERQLEFWRELREYLAHPGTINYFDENGNLVIAPNIPKYQARKRAWEARLERGGA